MKTKQLNRALHDLGEEGVVQVFYPLLGSQQILGVVGTLQLDVLQSRLQQEYGVEIRYEPVSVVAARWIETEDADARRRFVERNRGRVAKDRDEALVLPAREPMGARSGGKDWPELKFSAVRERG
jgi:peptide chain release factor 3